MAPLILRRVRQTLREKRVPFQECTHTPTRTSKDSAAARGESLSVGGKALVLKVGEQFAVFVLSADRQLDARAIRRRLGVRKSRFATREELRELTGLTPGSVPPFGDPILPFPLYLDESVIEKDRIAFNAGSLTHSITLRTADYLSAARPQEVFSFSKPASAPPMTSETDSAAK